MGAGSPGTFQGMFAFLQNRSCCVEDFLAASRTQICHQKITHSLRIPVVQLQSKSGGVLQLGEGLLVN